MLVATEQELHKVGPARFRMNADAFARYLIGAVIVRRVDGLRLRARIVETEAYLGPADLASHASKGRTRRTEVMFGPAGRAYVYLIYGMHDMFNVVCGRTGKAHAVLVRAAQPLDGWLADLSGPGRLARALRITRSDNALDLSGDEICFFRDPKVRPAIATTPRIGIDYAGEWRERPLRFVESTPPSSTRPRDRARTRMASPASMR